MKIMENKLKQLEKENEDDFFRIRSEERRKEVSRMIKYISSSSLPLYQIQICLGWRRRRSARNCR